SMVGSTLWRRATTWSACQRARAEPRVATRRCTTAPPAAGSDVERRIGASRRVLPLDLEQLAEGGDQAVAPGAAGRVLEHHRRVVQQLGDHAPGDGLDHVELARVEVVVAGAEAVELGGAHGLGTL